MALYETSRPAHHGASFGLTGRFFSAFNDWNGARQTRKALSKLSDRELDDIGLTRSDINVVSERG